MQPSTRSDPVRRKPCWALVDCNSFFVSCEKLFRPDLVGKAVVVLSNNDGCVVSRSAEAKALGIPMGEAFFKIKDLIRFGKVIVFSSNFELYGNMSARVMRRLAHWTPHVEVYSIDEAFLDLTGLIPDGCESDPAAAEIARSVHKSTGIPVSLGLGPNRTLAKVANDMAKKGLGSFPGVGSLLDPSVRRELLAGIGIEDIWGVGRRLAPKMRRLGLRTGADLTATDPLWMRRRFSVVQERLVRELNGENCMGPDEMPEARKSIQVSRTFRDATDSFQDLSEAVSTFAVRAAEKSRAQRTVASGIYVHLNTSRFGNRYLSEGRATGFPIATAESVELIHTAQKLLRELYRSGPMYKKATVILLDLKDAEAVRSQGTLFPLDDRSPEDRQKRERLMESIDSINGQMGRDTLFFGSQGFRRDWRGASEHKSPAYMSQWDELPVAKAK